MGMHKRRTGRKRATAVGALLALGLAGSASAALQQLPPGDQVNNDPAAGIDPAKPVDIANDPANSDVTGGSLTGGVNVPWAVFRQKTTGADQVFSRSFAGGKWTTRGNGTTGGLNNGPFTGSLNFDQTKDGEAPSIDFAGANRAIPWATWYEDNTHFGHSQVFASRFDNASNKWIFSGQDRGGGVPSLNINTNQDAENPVVAGGSAADPTKPGPWVTWQETDANGSGTSDQIFVSKPLGPGQTNCTGVKPAAANPSATPLGGFCFQQVGIDRVNGNVDPSLNIDPKRDAIEPDIAFTGTNDGVPWVVWYEIHNGSVGNNNDQVFAAKAVAPDGTQTGAVDGGFNWIAVGGNGGTGKLDVAPHNNCLSSLGAEQSCTLNADPTASAVDPRVAAGTMTPGNPTVPWVAWEETFGGHERIFVSRLVAGAFKLANGGQPLPTLVNGIDAKRPDITFSGNTPYVSWHEGSTVVTGHFTTPDSFVTDNGAVGTDVSDNVRAPISSGCTADPFNGDGSACQAGAVGTPFFLFSDGDQNHAKLFADAYQADNQVTSPASNVTGAGATLNGSVNPEGAAVNVSFDFGKDTTYGSSTPAQKIGPSDSATPFSANLTGLAPGTTVHYRAVITSDFAPPVVGSDQTFTTTSPPHPPGNGHLSVGHASVSGTTASVRVSCTGAAGATCKVAFRMTVTEKVRGHKVIAVSARKQPTTRKIIVTVGSASTITLTAGQSKVVKISLNSTGKNLLKSRHTLSVTVDVTQILGGGRSRTLSQPVTFKVPKHKPHH
ncbi:MAG TPA: hypothetical protein VMU39_01105 [Solirubrobacteraceae bacterium]|nr:hypothetical protein [Solirubrobacteraceae bacterium]